MYIWYLDSALLVLQFQLGTRVNLKAWYFIPTSILSCGYVLCGVFEYMTLIWSNDTANKMDFV